MPKQEIVLQFRRGPASDWTSRNPVLRQAEPGYENETRRIKLGDGRTPWNDLEYFGEAVPSGGGTSDEDLLAHINSELPHPIYDDGPSLTLLYENAKV